MYCCVPVLYAAWGGGGRWVQGGGAGAGAAGSRTPTTEGMPVGGGGPPALPLLPHPQPHFPGTSPGRRRRQRASAVAGTDAAPPRRSRPALRRRRPRTSDWGVPAATNRPQAPAHTHLPLFLWPNLVESAESWPSRTPCARHPGQMRSRTSFTCAGPRGASFVEGTRHRWNNWVFSELRRRSTCHARSSLSVRTSGCRAAELTTSPFASTKKHEESIQPLNLASL